MTNNKIKCDDCEAEATHVNEPDPYYEEIVGEIKLCNMCDECYHNACMDI